MSNECYDYSCCLSYIFVIICFGQTSIKFELPIIPLQITVEDVTGNGQLDMIVVDTSGNVMCFNNRGKVIWEAEISGSSSPGSRVADINQDGILDVVIPTNNG